MADPLDVLTLAEAKRVLNIAESTTKYDDGLPLYVSAVSQRLDRYIGPVVKRPVEDETHDGGQDLSFAGFVAYDRGRGSEHVFLDFYPIVSIDSVSEYKGTTQVSLTRETNMTKPNEGYVVDRFSPDASLLSNRISRRKRGKRALFEPGTDNIVVSYTAGRFADTDGVSEKYKLCAGLMLQNMWRSQQDSTGQSNEFDVPQSSFPRWAIPRSVEQMLSGEAQEPRHRVL